MRYKDKHTLGAALERARMSLPSKEKPSHISLENEEPSDPRTEHAHKHIAVLTQIMQEAAIQKKKELSRNK